MNSYEARNWLMHNHSIVLNHNTFEKVNWKTALQRKISPKHKSKQTQEIVDFINQKLRTANKSEKKFYLGFGEAYIKSLKKDKSLVKIIETFDRHLVQHRSETKFATPKNQAAFRKWVDNKLPAHIYKNYPDFCSFLEKSSLLSQMKIALDEDLPTEIADEVALKVNGQMMKWSEIQGKFELIYSERYKELFIVEKSTREVYTYLPNGKGLQNHHPYMTEKNPLAVLNHDDYEKVLERAKSFVRKGEENLSDEEWNQRNKGRTFIIQVVTSYVDGPETRAHKFLSRSKHPYLRVIVGEDSSELDVRKGEVYEVGYNWKGKVIIPLITTKGQFRSPDRWNYVKCQEKIVTNIPVSGKEALDLFNYTLKYHRDGVHIGKEMGFNLANQNCSSYERNAIAAAGVDIPTEITLSYMIAEIAPDWMRAIGSFFKTMKVKTAYTLKDVVLVFPKSFRKALKKTTYKITLLMKEISKAMAALSLVPVRASLGGAMGEGGVAFVPPGEPEKYVNPPLRKWKNWLKVTKINVPGVLQKWQREQPSTVVYKNPVGLTIVP